MKFLIVSLLLVGLTFAFRTQSTGVKGKLMCGSKPAVGVHLKLFDEDNGPDPDDILDQKTTDEEGNFELSGSSMELTPIDPEIRIFHDCNDHGSPCQREWVIRIPAKYITNGPEVSELMDLGVMNLEVKGTFRCGNKPAKQVLVKLIDDDFGPDEDDDLGKGYTDANGVFELNGFTTELTTIDPHLKIYHDCDDGINPCQRRWKFELPNHYIYSDSDAPKTLDIGTWNLEGMLPGESRDCIH